LKASFDPASYPDEPQPAMMVAEERAPYGRPDPTR
jgi:hypothetical protein